MRVFTTLAVVSLVGGCSFLDQIELNGPPRLDPNRVYLGTSTVRSISARETSRYACIDAPLYCEQHGIGFDCRCP